MDLSSALKNILKKRGIDSNRLRENALLIRNKIGECKKIYGRHRFWKQTREEVEKGFKDFSEVFSMIEIRADPELVKETMEVKIFI